MPDPSMMMAMMAMAGPNGGMPPMPDPAMMASMMGGMGGMPGMAGGMVVLKHYICHLNFIYGEVNSYILLTIDTSSIHWYII